MSIATGFKIIQRIGKGGISPFEIDMKKIPPLLDHHMHFLIEGANPKASEISSKIIAPLFHRGILSFYDMGGRNGHGFSQRGLCRFIKTAGAALYKKGGYGSFLGIGIQDNREIPMAVADNAAKGVDFIKVINSGIVSANPAEPVTKGGFSRQECIIIAMEAAERGLSIHCHANGAKSVADAVIAGAVSIEHGFFINQECLHIMAEGKTSWTPTIFALQAYRNSLSDREALRYLDSVIDRHIEFVYRAYKMGINIKAGSDSGARGVRHGEALFEELKLLLRAGLSEEAVLKSCTMEEQQIEEGNYLVVDDDFFKKGNIIELSLPKPPQIS